MSRKIILVLLVVLLGSTGVFAQKKKPRIKYYSITANRTFHVRMNPGTLSVVFYHLNLPNGRAASMSGSLTDYSSGNSASDNESNVSAKKTSHRNAKFIGGGAGGGALIVHGAVATWSVISMRYSYNFDSVG